MPPSGRSSRATIVSTAWSRPIRSIASATRSGSSAAGGSGWRVSTRQNPHARVHRSPSTMNVAVPSAQHSDRFGQPASSHTVTSPRSRIVRFSSSTSGPWWTFGPQPLRLAGLDRQPGGDAGRGQPGRQPHRLAGTGAPREQRQVVGPVSPGDVLALGRAVAPPLGGEPGDDVDDLAHRHVDALLGQRRHRPVGDPARHDVLAQVRHVGRDVEGEAVHRPPPLSRTPMAQILRGFGTVGVDPHARVLGQPAGRHAERGERVDHQLLDVAHVLGRRRAGCRAGRSGSRRAGPARGR